MSDFTALPIPYVPIADKAAEVRAAIDAARLSAANSFGGLQKLAIPGPFATDAEANTFGVPDDNLYYRSDGTVRAASHISLDLAFALDKTLTARTGPTPTFSRASSGLFVNANGILVGKTAGTTTSITPSTTANGTSVTVTVASGSVVGWLVGQSVSLIVDTDGGNDNDATELWLVGTIVSTTATELVFTVTEKTSTGGSATDWTLGYRGARFDHDATGVCKGLLIEEPRTNLVFPSETLTTQTRTVAAVANTLSFYGTGTVVLSGVHSATVVGTGVFPARTTLTFTPTAGSLTLTVTGTVQFAQLEAGAFATSYIPTTSGTAARSADVCSIVGDAFSSFYNQSEGTLFAEVAYINTSKAAWITTAYSGSLLSPSNYVSLLKNSSGIHRQTIVTNNLPQGNLDISGAVAGTQYKYAGAYKTNDAAFTVGGVAPLSDASVTLPVTTALSIGNTFAEYLNGHIARIQYFRKRLSNSKLQTITAP